MLGSSVGQFKLGEIFYRGSGNQGIDGEEVESVHPPLTSGAPSSLSVVASLTTNLCL